MLRDYTQPLIPLDLGLERLSRKVEEAALLRRLEREFEEELRQERECELREQREWEEKLASEFAEDNHFWHEEWGREGDAESAGEKPIEHMTEEEWRDYIATQMRRRKAPQYVPSEYQKKKQEEKEKRDQFDAYLSEKIAAEERGKEATRVQHRTQMQNEKREDFEEKWRAFEAAVGDNSFGPKPKIR